MLTFKHAMTSIKLQTNLPGPESRRLTERSTGFLPRALVPYGEIWVSSGSGAVVTDVDGNQLLDLIGGVGCLAVGHSHPVVVEAIEKMSRRYTHTDFSLIPYSEYVELAERLSDLCGGNRKVGFFNSGAEAVENAVKVARGSTGKPGIVCFEGAFHGRTFMAMSLTHREVPYKRGFGPFVPDVHRSPYPGLDAASLEASLVSVGAHLERGDIAAVIVEPVLGEGGFIVPPGGFLPALSALCDQHGSVLICDEVQSGYGRTGTFLAGDQFETRPGVATLGKSIAAGLPLSAVVGDSKWMDSLAENALGGTYVGNPIAIAAGLAVLDVIEKQDLMLRAKIIGEQLMEGWKSIAASSGAVAEVRGLGAMVGVEFVSSEVTRNVVDRAVRSGLLCMKAGRDANVIRHLMPLVISDDQISEALGIFAEAVEASL